MKKFFPLLSISILLTGCSISITPTPASSPTSSTSPMTMVTTVPTTLPTPINTVQIALVNEIGTPSATTFGCGDEIEMVNRTVSTTTPLKTAIEELLSVHTRDYGLSGLTTALYQNNFTVSSVVITGTHADIDLTGSIMMDGVCDNPRIQEQMKRTILQFPTITTYQIKLNGTAQNWNCLFNGSGSC
jgi:hypothetical protein